MAQFKLVFVALAFMIFFTDAADESGLRLACEGDELSEVKCKDNHVIQIERAEYGRDGTFMCTSSGDVNSTRICGMKDVYDIIRPLCEGKQRCDSLIATRANLKEVEKCENVNIYLKMYILCVRIEMPKDTEPQRPYPEESSKKEAKTIVMQSDKARTSFVQFDQVEHGGATSAQAVGLFIMLFVGMLGSFCNLY